MFNSVSPIFFLDNVVIIFLAILLPDVQSCYLYVLPIFLHMLKLMQKHAKCGSNYHTRWHLNTEKFKKLTSVPFLIVARTPKNDRLCSIATCKWWIDVLLINDAVTKTKYLKIEFWIPYPLVPDWFLQPKSFLD